MVRVVLENERLFINDGMALLANVLAQAPGFLSIMARTAKVSENNQRTNNNGQKNASWKFTNKEKHNRKFFCFSFM